MSAARHAVDELPDAVARTLSGLAATPRRPPERFLSAIEQFVEDLDPGNDNDLQPLMARLRDKNQDPWKRESMIEALSRWHRAPGSHPGLLLAEIFADEREDGRARIRAASVLGRHPIADVLIPQVRPVARDARATLRAWALLLLAESTQPNSLADARVDESPLVRRVAEHLASAR